MFNRHNRSVPAYLGLLSLTLLLAACASTPVHEPGVKPHDPGAVGAVCTEVSTADIKDATGWTVGSEEHFTNPHDASACRYSLIDGPSSDAAVTIGGRPHGGQEKKFGTVDTAAEAIAGTTAACVDPAVIVAGSCGGTATTIDGREAAYFWWTSATDEATTFTIIEDGKDFSVQVQITGVMPGTHDPTKWISPSEKLAVIAFTNIDAAILAADVDGK